VRIYFHQTGSVREGSYHLQLIKFWPSRAPGKGVCGGAKIYGSALLQPVRNVCVAPERFFHYNCDWAESYRPISSVTRTKSDSVSNVCLIYIGFYIDNSTPDIAVVAAGICGLVRVVLLEMSLPETLPECNNASHLINIPYNLWRIAQTCFPL